MVCAHASEVRSELQACPGTMKKLTKIDSMFGEGGKFHPAERIGRGCLELSGTTSGCQGLPRSLDGLSGQPGRPKKPGAAS